MKKYLCLMLLALLPLSNSFAQGEKKNEKKHRLSFVNIGFGLGIYASPDGMLNINLQAVDLNIAPNFAKGFGLRLISAGSTMFFYGEEWHHMAGPSYTFKFRSSAGTLALLGGASLEAFGQTHEDYYVCTKISPRRVNYTSFEPPKHRGDSEQYVCRRKRRANWSYSMGISYKHRLLSYEDFNLSMGVDILVSKQTINVLPNIGCSISW